MLTAVAATSVGTVGAVTSPAGDGGGNAVVPWIQTLSNAADANTPSAVLLTASPT